MKKNKIISILTFSFIGLMVIAWAFSLNLRQKIMNKNSASNSKVQAIVEVAKLRNLAESQIANSLSFFLMGSTHFFDEQKKDKQNLTDGLVAFEKNYNLPSVPGIIQRINSFRTQQQDFFEQAQQFRAKQTESKIVGQFYRSKTAPLRTSINVALNEILELHNADFERAKSAEEISAKQIESQIPVGMMWFTIFISVLFSALIFFVLRLQKINTKHIAERERIAEVAKSAVHTSHEIISAVAQDFNDDLTEIIKTCEIMKNLTESHPFRSGLELIQSHTKVIEDSIRNITDETKTGMGNLNLRVEQLELDTLLDEAQLWLEPRAKQKDIRLEFIPANPPVLAFIDRERVLRVLFQIAGNAIKFSPIQSKIIIKVRSDQQFVFISVKDQGPGISEKKLQTVFNGFWQAKKTAGLGAGVGLSIAKKIIESHGGAMTAESNLGQGCTFTFSLPRRRPASAYLKKPASPLVRIANA
jgi:signal transduction histidine kinase